MRLIFEMSVWFQLRLITGLVLTMFNKTLLPQTLMLTFTRNVVKNTSNTLPIRVEKESPLAIYSKLGLSGVVVITVQFSLFLQFLFSLEVVIFLMRPSTFTPCELWQRTIICCTQRKIAVYTTLWTGEFDLHTYQTHFVFITLYLGDQGGVPYRNRGTVTRTVLSGLERSVWRSRTQLISPNGE